MIKDARAYQPFSLGQYPPILLIPSPQSNSTGRHTCLGASLAMSELRIVTALLVSKFSFQFSRQEDLYQVVDDCFDHFSMEPGKLTLRFQLRERKMGE